MGWTRTDEWVEGYQAAKTGNDDCPYSVDTEQWRDWVDGYGCYYSDLADKEASLKYGF